MRQNMTDPSWSTVTFVRGSAENVQRFVSYHLGMGANPMQMFFDAPEDPCIDMLSLDRSSFSGALRY